jgi:NADH-quinone oxidoreductase subunit M
MISLLLILIPLIAGIISFFIRSEKLPKQWAVVSSVATFAITLYAVSLAGSDPGLVTDGEWIPNLNSRFSLAMDGIGKVLVLLTGIAFPVIFLSTFNSEYRRPWNFYAFMLLSQAGLMGVFLATDALLFYFFWELALIPAYFLCSQWGGERRIQVTFKFFIYTFIASLFMLVGIIYLYSKTPDLSFSYRSFSSLDLSVPEQTWLFWLMFIAFAVKMPIFPFHTWQPDTYEQSPTAVTMVLSGLMVKMGVFGILRWLVPVLPTAVWAWGDTVSVLCIIGMLYASVIAIRQDDLKRLVAYSSIAHMGLMGLAIFASNDLAVQGVVIQMFSHGINIIGLWIVVELIERQFKTRKMSELGGLAQKAPALAILLVVVALANVSLPLTNSFIGEFMMFAGVFNSAATKYNFVFAAVAGISIILSAVYTLNMIQKVFYGNTTTLTSQGRDIRPNETMVLGVLVILIIVFGVYPQPLLELSAQTVDGIVSRMMIKQP